MLIYFHTNYFPLILLLVFIFMILVILSIGVVIIYKTVRNPKKKEMVIFDRRNEVSSAPQDYNKI